MKTHAYHIESPSTVTSGAALQREWTPQSTRRTQPTPSISLMRFDNLVDLELYVMSGPVQLPTRYLHLHTLVYCSSGSLRLNRPGWARGLRRGDFATLRAGGSASLHLDGGSASCILISFTEGMGSLKSSGRETPHNPPQPEGRSPSLTSALRDLFSALAAAETPPTLESDLAAGLASLSRSYAPPPSPKREHPAVVHTRKALHDAPERRFSLDELARIAHLNKSHLVEVFKRDVGVTPLTYQMCLRLHLSKEGLRQNVPIAQVALELGFSDQSHFTRTFKTFLGVTPGRFQRSGFPG